MATHIRNLYATPTLVKARPQIPDNADSTLLSNLLHIGSAIVEDFCGRVFYSKVDTRTFSPSSTLNVPVDDLLSVTTFKTDPSGDLTYSRTWTSDDYILSPKNSYPALRVRRHPDSDYWLSTGERGLQIAGVWGYGDGSSDPWSASGITGTVANATGTTLTLSAEGTIKVGHTIKAGDEQMYVEAVSSDDSKTATVIRGVNGTTAAAHSTASISQAQYPPPIIEAVIQEAMIAYLDDAPGNASASWGDYRVHRLTALEQDRRNLRLLGSYRRGAELI